MFGEDHGVFGEDDDVLTKKACLFGPVSSFIITSITEKYNIVIAYGLAGLHKNVHKKEIHRNSVW